MITFAIELKAKIQKLLVREFNPLLHLYDLLTNIMYDTSFILKHNNCKNLKIIIRMKT